jgi:hypothetical protein
MNGVFLGEEGKATSKGSVVMGTNTHSPPDESVDAYNSCFANRKTGHTIDAWLEVWDYSSGSSFRGFVGGNGDKKSLFTFFGSSVIGGDLKQGWVHLLLIGSQVANFHSLMALIELAETVFAVSQVVICLDRSVPEDDRKAFMKSVRWVGFEMATLDMWADALDVTSDKWLFLGMEIWFTAMEARSQNFLLWGIGFHRLHRQALHDFTMGSAGHMVKHFLNSRLPSFHSST